MCKENVLAEIASLLAVFADAGYQRRVWLRGEGPEVDSFADATIGFISGCAIDHVMDIEWVEWDLPQEPLEPLREFRQKLGAFTERSGSDAAVESVLSDPEWPEVRRLAGRVLSVFRRHGLSGE